jgi:formate hydrogenlyase subunit 6/NADH:ubiquinone oxidoreductase subunit I
MKIGALLGDVARSLFKPAATVQYPLEPSIAPDRLRGKLIWDYRRCTGCNLCVKDCPANAINLIILDRKQKRFVMEYDENRCIYCAQCVQSCRFQALRMSNTVWELAALKKDAFKVYYGRYDDIHKLINADLADATAGGSE